MITSQTCSGCGIPFKRKLIATRIPKHPFCSKICSGKHLGASAKKLPTITVPCGHCGNSVTRNCKIHQSSKSRHLFCNSSCAAHYHNNHKSTGTRRSKLEGWLEDQLRVRYPDLDLHCNRTDAVNAELDFYFPGLRLAFELNGILHYEPIYGSEKLARIQTNDGRKFQACLENRIELCVVDSSRFTYFKIKGAEEFLELFARVIDRVLVERLLDGSIVRSSDPTRGRTAPTKPQPPLQPVGRPRKEVPAKVHHFRASLALGRVLGWESELSGGTTQTQIAHREGVSKMTISKMMNLLKLPESVKFSLINRDPSVGFLTVRQAYSKIERG